SPSWSIGALTFGASILRSFSFGPFILVPERQSLTKAGATVHIGSRALEILTALVERPGELMSKAQLVSRAWPDTFVEESNLKVTVAALRRALGDAPSDAQYIATASGRGYRFVSTARVSWEGDTAAPISIPAGTAGTRGNNLPVSTTHLVGRSDALISV